MTIPIKYEEQTATIPVTVDKEETVEYRHWLCGKFDCDCDWKYKNYVDNELNGD